MLTNRYSDLSDKELIAGVVMNDSRAIEYLFFEKCSRLLIYILNSIFDGKVEKDELLNELFLYLASDNWRKLRDFDFKSSLSTWISIVAIRFFQRKRSSLIESTSSEALIIEGVQRAEFNLISIDIGIAISQISNQRYRTAIQLLDIEDKSYDDVAAILGVSVPNLYNIHRRALAQLKFILL